MNINCLFQCAFQLGICSRRKLNWSGFFQNIEYFLMSHLIHGFTPCFNPLIACLAAE